MPIDDKPYDKPYENLYKPKETDTVYVAPKPPVAHADEQPLVLPDIHFLQAERASLQMNRDAIDPPQNDATDAAIKEIDAKIAAIDKTLAANKHLTGN
jgi:hypothetical protein